MDQSQYMSITPCKMEDLEIGDMVLEIINPMSDWKKIKSIDESTITLENDKIIQKSFFRMSCFAYSAKEYAKQNKLRKLKNCFYKNHEETLNKSVERSPLTEYNLYKINWNLDDDELYDFKLNKFITDVIISAKTPEEALENVKKIGDWKDIDDAFMWQDERYLVCELIGRSYLSNNGIIAYQRHNKYE